MQIDNLLADRTTTMGINAIREILKVVSRPGMVSLAGGIPSPTSFPMKIIPLLIETIIDKYASSAFQYDATEGFYPLRESLVQYLHETKKIKASADEVFISSGSQGVLDAVGKAFISAGDRIGVESPTYLGAIQAFDPYGPEYISLKTDDNGLIPDSLESVLKRNRLKFIYLVPTFQNPTGRTLSMERRKRLADILRQHDILLIEDDPYSDLRYDGQFLPPIKSMAPDHVVYIGTFSKIFAPGLRIGYYVAPEHLREWLVIVKQGVDLHTSTFNQALAAEYLSGGHLQRHLPLIVDLYKPKRDVMLNALKAYFPVDFHWSKPQGGMFIWVEGPKALDMGALYRKSVRNNVAFVPGKYFFTDKSEGIETMRLNFTMADELTIDSAIQTLSKLL